MSTTSEDTDAVTGQKKKFAHDGDGAAHDDKQVRVYKEEFHVPEGHDEGDKKAT